MKTSTKLYLNLAQISIIDLGRGSKTTDLALRKDVKNQIEKKRISLLNIRKQNVCNLSLLNLTIGSEEEDHPLINSDGEEVDMTKSYNRKVAMQNVNKPKQIAKLMVLAE